MPGTLSMTQSFSVFCPEISNILTCPEPNIYLLNSEYFWVLLSFPVLSRIAPWKLAPGSKLG